MHIRSTLPLLPIQMGRRIRRLQYFKADYTGQVQGAFEPLFRANIDAAIINIGHEDLSHYKLVVVPADYVMDEASAKNIRDYVEQRRHGADDCRLC